MQTHYVYVGEWPEHLEKTPTTHEVKVVDVAEDEDNVTIYVEYIGVTK